MKNLLPGWIDSLPAPEERRPSMPMGRGGRAGEVTVSVSVLAAGGAGSVTGQRLRGDGGPMRAV